MRKVATFTFKPVQELPFCKNPFAEKKRLISRES